MQQILKTKENKLKQVLNSKFKINIWVMSEGAIEVMIIPIMELHTPIVIIVTTPIIIGAFAQCMIFRIEKSTKIKNKNIIYYFRLLRYRTLVTQGEDTLYQE